MSTLRSRDDFSFVVIGAGMAGVLAAIKLREAGFAHITVYEKGDSVGGTWRENTYPGLTCDLAAHAYTYRFERNPNWSRVYAEGPEIHEYFKNTADKYGITGLIRFNEEVSTCVYDGSRWQIETRRGTHDTADFVIAATGVLHHPVIPKIDGLEAFEGACFHSARWDHTVPLDDRRIGVIGNGSTGIQLVSALWPRASELFHFQRTAQWMVPYEFKAYTEAEKTEFRKNPALIEEIARQFLYSKQNYDWMRGITDLASDEMKQVETVCREYLDNSVKDPKLREHLRPNYRAACKRLLYTCDYYDSIQRPNVELVTNGIERIEAKGVRFETGRLIKLDVLALATGFNAAQFMRPMKLIGSHGADLDEFWQRNPKAYLSVSMPDFPNFFMLNGPNAPVGNFSLIDIAEKQMDYVRQLIDEVVEGRCRALCVSRDAMERFDAERKEAAKKTIFAAGCKSWYLDADGIPALWPFTYQRFDGELSKPRLDDYDLVS